jgi:hypothetical protein
MMNSQYSEKLTFVMLGTIPGVTIPIGIELTDSSTNKPMEFSGESPQKTRETGSGLIADATEVELIVCCNGQVFRTERW